MDFDVIVKAIFALLQSSESMVFLLSSLVVCVLSRFVKIVFGSKLKTQLLHKFDISVILPFVFGTLAAICNAFILDVAGFNASALYGVFVQSLSIGATATILQRLWEMLFSGDLNKLLKDDLFSTIYHEIMFLSSAKDKLLKGEISLENFLQRLIKIKDEVGKIYSNMSMLNEEKTKKLTEIVSVAVDADSLSLVVKNLDAALCKLFKPEN